MRILQGPRPHVESQSLSNKTGLIKKHEWSQRMRKKEISGVVWLWMVVLYLELLTFLLDCLPLPRVGGVMEGDNGREKELARETQLVSSCNCASDSRSFLRATVHSEWSESLEKAGVENSSAAAARHHPLLLLLCQCVDSLWRHFTA